MSQRPLSKMSEWRHPSTERENSPAIAITVVLLLLVALVVGGLVLAMYMPVFDVAGSL